MKKIFLPVVALLVGLLVMVARGPMTPNDKLRVAEAVVANYYVDTVNEDKLVEAAIVGMLKELDPHSSYTNAEETKAMNEPLEGSFSGVGISYNLNQDTLYVLQVVSGGPSERVGILPGDRVIAVDDSIIAGVKMTTAKIMKKLRGPKGTKVKMQVLRRSFGKPDQTIDFVVTRDVIPIHSVDAAYMADPATGYIRLNKFAATTPDEFRKAAEKLRKQGMKNLILDLTDNGGGYLSAATQLLGEMLAPGSLTVYTEGVNSPRQEISASPRGSMPLFADGRLVVMANQYSASASEILSGAVQDWDRGVVVGRPSFGKGLVQRQIGLSDGSAVRITVARYHTPSGRVIQRPYEKGKRREYYLDHLRRYDDAARDSLDAAAPAYRTLRTGRTVYGGGGIRPDILVEADTAGFSNYYGELIRRGIVADFVGDWLDGSRDSLSRRYASFEAFDAGYTPSDEVLERLTALGESRGVKFDAEGFAVSEPLVRMQLKALAAQRLFGTGAYFRVINPAASPAYARAVAILEDWDKSGQPVLEP
mgnify:CR=1 FL=1